MAAHNNTETFSNSWNSPVTSTVSSLPYSASSSHYPHPYPDMSKYYNPHIAGGECLSYAPLGNLRTNSILLIYLKSESWVGYLSI